ncbi:MAG: alpha/beta fold hydrolase [Synechocystis sp.]
MTSLETPTLPPFTESTSIHCWQQRQCQGVSIAVEDGQSPLTVNTSYIDQGQGSPLLLLHGFDSSLLEFRRLLPLLSPHCRAIAVDLLGFGFTERHPQFPPTPANIKRPLDSFWQERIQAPMVLVGVSMGGAAALDFCLSFPERVEKLILIDSAGLASQPFASRLMFPPVDRWLTRFLASPNVRQNISQTAYYDKRFASADAQTCASLHLHCPGWSEGLIAFTKSGGYGSFRQQLPQLTLPSLIIWGRQDKILGTKAAHQFAQLLPHNQLSWIDQCGHVPHLEQAEETAVAIGQFLRF